MNPTDEPTNERGLNVRLSTKEKTALAILGRQAWQVMTRNGATDEAEAEFRHRIALNACGRRVSEALRRDFNSIKASFLIMLGDTDRALNAADRSATEGSRLALHKLRAALKAADLHEGYAEAVCRRQFKCGLHEATSKQLWNLFYTVTNRIKARDKASRHQGIKAPSHAIADGIPF